MAVLGQKLRKSFSRILEYMFLILIAVFILYPILYIVFGSFKQNAELLAGGFNIFPHQFIFDNYVQAWTKANFAKYTFNSLFLSACVMVGVVVVSSMTGYCFARKDFPLKKFFYGLILAFLFINVGSVSLYPLYKLAVSLHMQNSLWPVIIITIGTGLTSNIIIVRSYVSSIPKELDEAATIDGCSFFGIYWQILMPIMVPILATVALLSFRTGWNQYVLPLVFTMNNAALRPLTVGVVSLMNTGDAAAAWNLMFAGASMSIVPIVVIYIFTSKYFISGLTNGAVKG